MDARIGTFVFTRNEYIDMQIALKGISLLLWLIFASMEQAFANSDIPPSTNSLFLLTSNTVTLQRIDPLGDFNSLAIPLKRVGRLFMIEAKVDNQTGNLIFDTGASGIVLNRTYFRNYVSFEKPMAGGGVRAAFDKMYRISVKHIQISSLYYENLDADVSDLSHIENRRGVKVLGLLGINLLQDFEVVFDARNNQLQLFRLDRQGNRIEKETKFQSFDFNQKIDTRNSIIILNGKVGEKDLNFCLDTGAETNVIDSQLPKKVMQTVEVTRRSTLQGAAAGSKEVLYGRMHSLQFGKNKMSPMETIITPLGGISEAFGCAIGGILGYDFWINGIYSINFKKQQLSYNLWKGDNQ